MIEYTVAHKRPQYGRPGAKVVGSWTVVAVTWAKALEEAHEGIHLEEGDYLSWPAM